MSTNFHMMLLRGRPISAPHADGFCSVRVHAGFVPEIAFSGGRPGTAVAPGRWCGPVFAWRWNMKRAVTWVLCGDGGRRGRGFCLCCRCARRGCGIWQWWCNAVARHYFGGQVAVAGFIVCLTHWFRVKCSSTTTQNCGSTTWITRGFDHQFLVQKFVLRGKCFCIA